MNGRRVNGGRVMHRLHVVGIIAIQRGGSDGIGRARIRQLLATKFNSLPYCNTHLKGTSSCDMEF